MLPVLPALALASALVAQDAPAAGTSAAVVSFLDESVASMYDPEDDGLTSLAFVVPVEEAKSSLNLMLAQTGMALPESTPDMVRMANVTVDWKAGQPPQVSGAIADDFPQALAPMRPQIEATTAAIGQQVLGAARQKLIDFESVLASYDGRLDGTEDGMVKVVFDRKASVPEQMAPSRTLTWLFDDDGMPKRTYTTVEVPTPMGKMSIEEVTDYGWALAREDGGSHVLDTVTIVRKQGGMEAVKQMVDYDYRETSGVMVLTNYTETITPLGPMAAMMPAVEKQVVLTDVQVGVAGEEG